MADIVVRVVPNARRTESVGLMADGSTWKIRVAAPAVDGKANVALCRFIAERCDVRSANVHLVSGDTSRTKRIAIDDVDPDVIRRGLTPS